MTNPLIPSEALEGVMKKVFLEQAVAPGLFWDALLKSNLVVPLANAKIKNEGPEPEKDEEIPLLLGVDDKGRHVIWLFTSVPAMVDYTERDLPYIEMLSQTLFTRLRKSEREIVLIGPDGLTLQLHPDFIQALSEGRVPENADQNVRHVPKDAEVYVSEPEEEPVALQEKFKTLFENVPQVLEASFIQISDDQGPRLLLGLRLKEDSRHHLREVAELVAKAAEGTLAKGATMDITLIEGSLKGAFEKWGKPFFKR